MAAARKGAEERGLANFRVVVGDPPEAPRVRVRGLGAFGRDVIFAKVEPSHELDRVTALVEASARVYADRLSLATTPVREGTWTAHLTLLKTSRVRGRRPKPCLPPVDRDEDFGTHELGALELCAMVGVGEGGYYPVLESVPLGGRPHLVR